MDPLIEAYLGVYEEFVPLTPDKEEKGKKWKLIHSLL